jgi:glutamate N-acetyltransferase/amino-acid N-acetyltransferase
VSVTAARGFVASGVHCGVKPADLDLSLVATASGEPVTAAAVFTANKMTAAPVLTSRAHLEASGGRAAAVVLNSGNANAATGGPGREHAEQMCASVATELGCVADEVLVCSTGLIGIPLPIDAILTGIPAVAAARSADGGVDAAEAIRTTDTFRKEAAVTRGGLTVGGMAKGAAMLAPNMATMLAVLTTDAAVDHATLDGYLRAGDDARFNRLVVDGCTSTNDTVILLASGVAGPPDEPKDLAVAIAEVCESLASQMARDAEGATKVVRLEVRGAASDADADRGVRAIATSQLTKCSWYGCDPYWGRVASDLGSAGIAFDPDRLSVSYGGVIVARGGVSVPHDTEEVAKHMAERDLSIVADLGLGEGAAQVLTNDLTHAYVDENMGTS